MGKSGESRTVFFFDAVHAHDPSAEYGTDPKNPIRLPSIPMAYSYLDSLYFEDGADAVYTRVSTCHTDSGHTMDVYEIKRPDSEKSFCRLYFDCYVPNARPDVPVGFYLKIGDKKLHHGDVPHSTRAGGLPSKQGCLLPLVATLGVLFAFGSAIASIIK